MAELTLDVARKILDAALAKAVENKLKPLVVTILDARGVLKIAAAQDGTSLMRAEIAHGKAYGALALGIGSRALYQRAQEQAFFVDAVNTIARGAAGRPGDHLPSSTMCSANSTAHARTRTSPNPIPLGPPVRKRRPPRERMVATQVHQWIGAPFARLSSGVKTTKRPVIRPALPGLVIVSPTVWAR